MAFKSKSVKRFSVRGFLAAILHPFMTSPTDAPGVFTLGDSCNNVGDWHTLLLNNELSSQCELEHMVCCKCTTSVEHEFLLLHFRHPTQHHAVAILVLDRTSRPDYAENNHGNGSLRSVGIGQSTIVSPSVSATPAHDSIFTTPNNGSAIESYLTKRYGQHKYLFNLKSSTFPLPLCYWYAYTVWEALKRLFPGCRETTLSEGRSRFCGQEVRKAESVGAVCELYRAEWARFENAVEERRRAKEEEVHRLRMEGLVEGRAQRQPEVDKERRHREEVERKANEAERRADEERRQREEEKRKADAESRRADEERRQREEAEREYEVELNRMQARMAELERCAV
ncbi:hypothetical protein DFJ58DRAFT_736261 [Suillus subalutaceus]|uniref:uncharacterized protein n=1 Tax=Suillus subalutaceus TaxID=48586 RepID=UPI001B87B3C3|nr:uncharacterized protein DFJ58DRAFT_736261 [Suillus subalutaceus]KAG1832858.1 hypothetical protein DFJ58DRAFT_736261 [Suillus subalutaceus]